MSEPERSLFDCDQMLLLLEAPAKTCQWPDDVMALLDSDRVFSSDAWSYVLRVKPLSFAGRTCLEFSAATTASTLPPSLKRLQASVLRSRRRAGAIPACASGRSTPLPGLCWTRNGEVWRNGGSVCSLSQVLEGGPVPTKYFLSPKAAAGILRRAAKRKRTLPAHLEAALTAVALAGQDGAEKTT